MRPRLLDLFCCAGGAAKGYHDAGFEVVGVDLAPQPNYPYEFIQGDALDFLRRYLQAATMNDVHEVLKRKGWGIDAVHASPPCQHYCTLAAQNKLDYPDLVGPTRELLLELGLPYVIENVTRAPLIDPVVLCGTMFGGLRVLRHRGFETNWPLAQPFHPPGKHPLVFTHDKRKAHYGKLDQNTSFVQVTGGGNATLANKLDAMGIDWMTNDEVYAAIPPAYTRYVGRRLKAHIEQS
jgi:DNA (cytosine-5)-methyltransferase 1